MWPQNALHRHQSTPFCTSNQNEPWRCFMFGVCASSLPRLKMCNLNPTETSTCRRCQSDSGRSIPSLLGCSIILFFFFLLLFFTMWPPPPHPHVLGRRSCLPVLSLAAFFFSFSPPPHTHPHLSVFISEVVVGILSSQIDTESSAFSGVKSKFAKLDIRQIKCNSKQNFFFF